MIAPNLNLLCGQAKPYYYDFLCNKNRGLIPGSIVSHIRQCEYCQEQVNQLNDVLSEPKDDAEPEQRQVGSAATAMLKLHLAYIGERVTCETVRPFLPGLLDIALEIRIPTPITTHLDNCRQCAKDLETIRRLNLNRKQLHRLSQLFAGESPLHSETCSEMGEIAQSVAAMYFGGITAGVLKHLCKCPVCRDSLYRERQKICDSLSEYGQSWEFPCESVSATDIFDYVVPYGLDPANDQYAKFRGSLSSHLGSCTTCLGKMQELHRTIYSIADRAESEVVTIYHIDESAKAQSLGESGEPYAGFPIRVEIAGSENRLDVEQPRATIDFAASLKQRVSALKVKPLLGTGLAAAAVILIGLVFLLNAPSARAVTIEQIYRAIESVKNVYIATFAQDQTEPIQERWVSRALNIYMSKTGKELVLRHVSNRVQEAKYLDTGLVEVTPMSTEMVAKVEKTISGTLGLLPFSEISEIPKNAEWSYIKDDDLRTGTRKTEVYDLRWADKAYDGSVLFKKWRVFVEPKTNCPQRTEFYDKLSADGEYALRSVKVIEYLSDSEMEAVVKEASF